MLLTKSRVTSFTIALVDFGYQKNQWKFHENFLKLDEWVIPMIRCLKDNTPYFPGEYGLEHIEATSLDE